MDDSANAVIAIPEELSYLAQYQILACLTCKTGIRPGKAAETHLRNVHQWKGKLLKEALSYILTLQLQDPHTARLPPNGSAAIPELGKPAGGYSCVSCGFLTPSREHISLHLRKTRHWREDGRSWETVKVQTFSRGHNARYWVVAEAGDVITDIIQGGGDDSVNVEDDWSSMLSQYETTWAEKRAERRRTVENPTGVENVSTWVREMGWAEHFERKDKTTVYLASLMARPANARIAARRRNDLTLGEVDPQLTQLGDSFDRVLKRCSGRLKLVPHETLRWLNSVDPTKPAGAPFKMKEHEDSMYRYRQFFKRCLCYSVRTSRLGRNEAAAQHGIQFNDVQWEQIQCVNEELSQLRPEYEDVTEEEERAELKADLDRAVFEYCVGLLRQKVAFKVFTNPLLHFCAVLGINDATGGWSEAKHYTASLAGLVWCGRILMLEHVFRDQPEDPEEVQVEMLEQFKEEHRQWLADGTHTPFSTMVRWMAYGKGFRKKEGGMAKVLWEENGLALRYLGQRITITDFCDAVNAGVEEAAEVLDGLMFGQWAEVERSIDLHRIVDSLMYEGPDSSFATKPQNAWLRPGFRFMAERSKITMWQSGRWKINEVRDYLRRLKVFKRLHLVNTHVWGGQPGRGPEVMTMKHCDTQQVIRNVFVFDGRVMIITDRDKSRAIRGLGRKVARFLPDKVDKMMVAYVSWLLPFEEMLHDETKIPGPLKSLSSYMWKDGRKGAWETTQLSESLASLTGQHAGVELMVSDYRHVAIGLGRKIKQIIIHKVELEMGEGDDENDDVTGEPRERRKMEYMWDLQATHGSVIARDHYAVDVRFPNQLQPEMIANYREISRLWHRFLECNGSVPAPSPVKHETDIKQEEGKNEIAKTSRKRKSDRMDKRDGKKRRKSRGGVVEVRDVQRGLEQLLGPYATWKIPQQGEAVEKIMGLTGDQSMIVVLPTGAGKSILFMLPALWETSGTNIVVVPFSALMDDLVDRARKSGVDCIRWKPATHEGREQQARVAKMVVVSADVADITQFKNYVDSIRARNLLDRIFVDECHTVIMDVSYRRKLEELKGLHRYGCPVILLTATLPGLMEGWFRRSMLVMDAAIIRASTVKRNIRYNVVRVTVEKNNSKRGGGVSEEIQDEVVRVVLRMEKTMQGDQKGVVYCRSQWACQALAERLGCDFYHSGIRDENERRLALKRWVDGNGGNRWITATTGLGTGVDIAGLVGVVHMEQPYGLVDFVQQTGRGGRRVGEVVESVVVMDQGKVQMEKTRSDVEHLNHQAMEWFVESTVCRRVTMGMFMDMGLDGCGQDCEQLQCELCDRCGEKRARVAEESVEAAGAAMAVGGKDVGREGREDGDGEEDKEEDDDSETEIDDSSDDSTDCSTDDSRQDSEVSSLNRLTQHVREKNAGLAALRQWLLEVGYDCAVCFVLWHMGGCIKAWGYKLEHGKEACPKLEFKKYQAWRVQVQFGDFQCCWRCGLPQSFCEGYDGKQGCDLEDKVMPVVMWAAQQPKWQMMMKTKLGIDLEDMKNGQAYIQWVGRSRRMYDENMTNAVAVWDMVVQEMWRMGGR